MEKYVSVAVHKLKLNAFRQTDFCQCLVVECSEHGRLLFESRAHMIKRNTSKIFENGRYCKC